MGEKSIAPSTKPLRLLRRSTIVTSTKTITRAIRPAVVKTAIIAGLLWKKDTAEDEDWDGVEDGAACALVINGSVSLEVTTTMDVGLGVGVSEGVDDVVRIEEGTKELATGEFVAEEPVVALLLRRVERNGFIAKHELTMYSTREQKMRSARTLPSSLSFGFLMRTEYYYWRRGVGWMSHRQCYEPPVCLHFKNQ